MLERLLVCTVPLSEILATRLQVPPKVPPPRAVHVALVGAFPLLYLCGCKRLCPQCPPVVQPIYDVSVTSVRAVSAYATDMAVQSAHRYGLYRTPRGCLSSADMEGKRDKQDTYFIVVKFGLAWISGIAGCLRYNPAGTVEHCQRPNTADESCHTCLSDFSSAVDFLASAICSL